MKGIILNTINPTETATALSITSITSNVGATTGGELVTITGDFDIPHVPTDIVQISASAHSLVLTRDNRLFSWGLGGRLGDGTWATSVIPVEVDMTGVLSGKTISYITTSNIHSLALSDEGRVYGWGVNDAGQIGDGTNIWRISPVAVDTTGVLAGKVVVQLFTGSNGFSLALSSDGNLYAWGGSGNPGTIISMGNGTWGNSNVPVAVDMTGVLAGRTITQAATGAHALVLDDEGNIFAWGNNASGQFGDGTTNSSNVPIAIDMSSVLDSGEVITYVAANYSSSFALSNYGNLFAWGNNSHGQLGNGTNINSSVPIQVNTHGALAGHNVQKISAAGGAGVLAQDSEGNLFTWGENYKGQLGDGTFINSLSPVAVYSSGALAGRTITQISAGVWHSLVLDSNGYVIAWGDNELGAIGVPTSTIYSNVPVLSVNLGTAPITNSIESITLGGLLCTNITVINPSTITCITPAHPAGVVDVTVNTTAGSATLYQSYTFVDAPDVPNTGHPRI